MNRNFLFLFIFLCFSLYGKAQVTVDVSIDTLLIRVGEQTKLHLQVSMDAGAGCDFPQFADTIVAGVECLEESKPVTTELNGGKRLLVSKDYTVTSFDSGHYYLPPLEVLVDQKPYRPKDIMNAPFVWEDWALVFWLSILLIPIIGICLYLIIRYRDNKPIIRHIKVTPKLPPHQKAMNEIKAIKSEKVWTPEDSKEYYTKLTDTLRNYIKERYGFNAMEMTSSEIIEHLTNEPDDQAMDELRELFQTSDLVKFAKYNALINENDRNLVNAVEFINKTKVEVDPAELNKKQELTVEEKRSRSVKLSLLGGIVILSLLSISILIYIGVTLYELCF